MLYVYKARGVERSITHEAKWSAVVTPKPSTVYHVNTKLPYSKCFMVCVERSPCPILTAYLGVVPRPN